MGAKKFGMPLETREIKLFWRDIPGFCWDIPEAPEKFEKKKFGFNFRSLYKGNGRRPDQPHFLRPPKVGLEGAWYVFLPSKTHDTFCPPPAPLPNSENYVKKSLGRRKLSPGKIVRGSYEFMSGLTSSVSF